MEKRMKIDPISKALNTEHGIDLSSGRVVSVVEADDVVEITELSTTVDSIDQGPTDAPEEDNINDPLEKTQEHIADEVLVKDNIRSLIDQSMDLAGDMFEIVRQSESPKAFEPAAAFLKTVVELNEKLLDVHDRDRKLKASVKKDTKQQSGQVINNTQNNIIYKQPSSILQRIKDSKKEGTS